MRSLDDRAVQRQHIERIVERAGETLSALSAWLFMRINGDPDRSPFDNLTSAGCDVMDALTIASRTSFRACCGLGT